LVRRYGYGYGYDGGGRVNNEMGKVCSEREGCIWSGQVLDGGSVWRPKRGWTCLGLGAGGMT
jgi:hypothetical protein